MTQNKETKEAAFRAWAMIEEEIVENLCFLTKKYQQAQLENATREELKEIFTQINKMCLVVIMKEMNKDPLEIIKQLDEIEKAVNIIKPTKS